MKLRIEMTIAGSPGATTSPTTQNVSGVACVSVQLAFDSRQSPLQSVRVVGDCLTTSRERPTLCSPAKDDGLDLLTVVTND